MPELRRQHRIAFQTRVRLRSAGRDHSVVGRVTNLSRSGIFVTAAKDLPAAGTEVDCNLVLDGQRRVLRGRVAWVRREDGPGAGIEFLDLTRQDDEILTRIVEPGADAPVPVDVWFEGMPAPIRSQAVVTEEGLRLSTKLPFLRLASTVKVSLVQEGQEVVRVGTLDAVTLRPLDDDGVPHLQLSVTAPAAPAPLPAGLPTLAPDLGPTAPAPAAEAPASPGVTIPMIRCPDLTERIARPSAEPVGVGTSTPPPVSPAPVTPAPVAPVPVAPVPVASVSSSRPVSSPRPASSPRPVSSPAVARPAPKRSSIFAVVAAAALGVGAIGLWRLRDAPRGIDPVPSSAAPVPTGPALPAPPPAQPPTAAGPPASTEAAPTPAAPATAEAPPAPALPTAAETPPPQASPPTAEATRPPAAAETPPPLAAPAPAEPPAPPPSPADGRPGLAPVTDGRSTTLTLSLVGSLKGARRYPLAKPPGVAVTLPHARLKVGPGVYRPPGTPFKQVWIQRRGPGSQIRFNYDPREATPDVQIEKDEVRLVLRRR